MISSIGQHRLASIIPSLQGHWSVPMGDSANVKDEDDNTALDITDNSRIYYWEDYHGLNKAVQDTTGDMPRWQKTDDYRAILFSNASKFLDLSTNITADAAGAFSMAFHFNCTSFSAVRSLAGHDENDLIQIGSTTAFKVKFGGEELLTFTAPEEVLMNNNHWYTMILTRNQGEEALINIFLYASDGIDGSPTNSGTTFAEAQIDANSITISNIGAQSDDTEDFMGHIQHVSHYNTALTQVERKVLRDYIINT